MIQTKWLEGFKTQQERDQFKQTVIGSKKVLDKAVQIVYNSIKEAEKVRISDYDSPSWSHKQADQNGYVRALREVMLLLEVSPDRER
jgi:hypothetical protein